MLAPQLIQQQRKAMVEDLNRQLADNRAKLEELNRKIAQAEQRNQIQAAARPQAQQQDSGGGMPSFQNFSGGGAAPASSTWINPDTGMAFNPVMDSGATYGEVSGGTPALGGGSGGGSGSSGVMGSLGPIAAIMAAVAVTKGAEYRSPDSAVGKLGQTFNAPSFNQIKADPKVGLTTLAGIPFINALIMNDKAKRAQPEWEQLFGF
jgi:TolA-binding protein